MSLKRIGREDGGHVKEDVEEKERVVGEEENEIHETDLKVGGSGDGTKLGGLVEKKGWK